MASVPLPPAQDPARRQVEKEPAVASRDHAAGGAVFQYGSVGVIVALSLVNRAYRLEIPPPPRPLTQHDWCTYDGEPS